MEVAAGGQRAAPEHPLRTARWHSASLTMSWWSGCGIWSAAFRGGVALQPLGNDAAGTPIFGLRSGRRLAARFFLIQAGIHGAEWVNTAALLRLAGGARDTPGRPAPALDSRALFRSSGARDEPAEYARGAPPGGETGRDLECNFDYQWDGARRHACRRMAERAPTERLRDHGRGRSESAHPPRPAGESTGDRLHLAPYARREARVAHALPEHPTQRITPPPG